MSSSIPLLLSIAIATLAISQTPCYHRDGSVASDYLPCNSTANGAVSACCDATAMCSNTGLCYGSAGFLYRGGCTDSLWASGSCPATICSEGRTDSYVNLMSCASSSHTFCCDYDGEGCCFGHGGASNFSRVSPGNPYPVCSSPNSTPATTSFSGSATASATGISPTTAAATPTNHKSQTTIGLAVGIPLGVVTLASLALLLYRERKRKRSKDASASLQRSDAPQGGNTQSYAPQSAQKQQYGYVHQQPGFMVGPQHDVYPRREELHGQSVSEMK